MQSVEKPAKPLRSQPTRDRILEAARKVFGRDGYEGATIRTIAAEAGITAAMVMRYYGNKELLFAAVTTVDIDVDSLSSVPRSKLGETIIRDVLDRWDDPIKGVTVLAILRSSMTNESARARFNEQYAAQLKSLIRRLAVPKVPQEAVGLISAQVIGVVVSRYILRLPSAIALSRDTIIREVGKTIQSYIKAAKESQSGAES
jgi:AcrR family transcriptional regulator